MTDNKWWNDTRKKYYADLAERVVWTFLQGFAAAWVVLGDLTTASLLVGITAGLVSLAKGLVAKSFGNPNSAATLSTTLD